MLFDEQGAGFRLFSWRPLDHLKSFHKPDSGCNFDTVTKKSVSLRNSENPKLVGFGRIASGDSQLAARRRMTNAVVVLRRRPRQQLERAAVVVGDAELEDGSVNQLDGRNATANRRRDRKDRVFAGQRIDQFESIVAKTKNEQLGARVTFRGKQDVLVEPTKVGDATDFGVEAELFDRTQTNALQGEAATAGSGDLKIESSE